MKKYILTIKEVKEGVKEFDTYEEAKEFANRLEMKDIDINVNFTYEIKLSEDYEEEQEMLALRKGAEQFNRLMGTLRNILN